MVFPDLIFNPPVIAHRGVRTKAPENTLAAFKEIPASGATWLETDIKLTHDGMPILMHDDTLDRTTNGKGAVADMTWADMQRLDAGSWFDPSFAGERVATLAELLRYANTYHLHVNLELKPCPGRTQATTMVALIEAAKVWPQDNPPPLISSFDTDALIIAGRLHPGWPRGLLLDAWRDDWQQVVKDCDASAIGLADELVTKQRVAKLVESHVPILVYTVNDPLRAKELLHWGVRAVFSDNPQAIIKAL
ncbi:MAG TPA: glycerophosphodiester phosphodiesterase [Alphaproteobacteria bacterium]|nr:glycerophosphodiester phosphodiesterase [Alphaproteobacteria bacterium]